MNKPFHERLLEYLATTPTAKTPFTTVRLQVLALGVVTVEDSLGEFDTYFDTETWGAIDPELWAETLLPPALEGYGIGVLGTQKRNFEQARSVAIRNLAPSFHDTWIEHPVIEERVEVALA